jgi:hypothetical protein
MIRRSDDLDDHTWPSSPNGSSNQTCGPNPNPKNETTHTFIRTQHQHLNSPFLTRFELCNHLRSAPIDLPVLHRTPCDGAGCSTVIPVPSSGDRVGHGAKMVRSAEGSSVPSQGGEPRPSPTEPARSPSMPQAEKADTNQSQKKRRLNRPVTSCATCRRSKTRCEVVLGRRACQRCIALR